MLKIVDVKMEVWTFVLISALLFGPCVPARILCVFPIPSVSHQVVYRALVGELAKRGHHIITITADPLGAKAPSYYENVTEIDVHDISYEIWNRGMSDTDIFKDSISGWRKIYNMTIEIAYAQMSDPQMTSLLKSNQTFDLVFAEVFSPISFSYADYFNAPVIGISSMSAPVEYFEAVGSPIHPFLYFDYKSEVIGKLNFWQKLRTLRFELTQRYDAYWYYYEFDEITRKHFGNNIRPIKEIENNMDMLFINSNPILNGARPTVPAVVYMGNMHIQPKKKLSQNLQTLLDNSTQGVIYFSLGTNIKSKNLPPQVQRSILSALGELHYVVLWKFESDTMPGKPDNVHISKWFPQRDLLGHPNIRAFITQGGLQSMEEAILDKVPFIGIPFAADQPFNVDRMVELGIGVRLKPEEITKNSFKEAIIKVAEGESYHKNVARISALLTDSPMTGLERAVWWTEYVLRHGGARHLRAPAADVNWIEYFMLDVLGTLLLLIVGTLLILYLTLKSLFRYIISSFIGRSKLKKH